MVLLDHVVTKSTVNPLLKDVAPPQRNMDDILSDLAGNKFFSNLDFTQAYNQMAIDEPSRELLTMVTHKGLFQYTRLPYGTFLVATCSRESA